MARYEHLPIFADAYRLALFVEEQVGGFANRQRVALGADLRAQCRLLVRLVISVNNQTDKRAGLEQLRVAVEEFQVLARLAKDTRAFASLKAYETCANLAYSVGRQTEGWLRSSAARRPGAGIDATS